MPRSVLGQGDNGEAPTGTVAHRFVSPAPSESGMMKTGDRHDDHVTLPLNGGPEDEASATFVHGALSVWHSATREMLDRMEIQAQKLGEFEARLRGLENGHDEEQPETVGWRGRLKARLHRFFSRDAEEAASPATRYWSDLRARPALVPVEDINQGKRVVGFTIFGLEPDRLSAVLDTIESYCRRRSTVAVILTDSNAFELFRERGLAFEYFPPLASRERYADDLQWTLYFHRRFNVFRNKWNPAGIVSFGDRTLIAEAEKKLAEAEAVDETEREVD